MKINDFSFKSRHLGLLWDHFWCMRVTLGVFRAHFWWHTRVTLGVLWCHFVVIFGVWGWLWVHFGATLGSLLVCQGAPGTTFELLWGHFVYIEVALGHFTITLGSLWSHFGCMKVDFQKNIRFPHNFIWFYKALEIVWSRFGTTSSIWRWLWEHFGATY